MFCVYVTFYGGNKLPPFYIGYVRVNRLFSGYHGSVSSKQYGVIWKEELRAHPELFKTKILKIYNHKEETQEREYFLQKSLSVSTNPLYSNKIISKIFTEYDFSHRGLYKKKTKKNYDKNIKVKDGFGEINPILIQKDIQTSKFNFDDSFYRIIIQNPQMF